MIMNRGKCASVSLSEDKFVIGSQLDLMIMNRGKCASVSLSFCLRKKSLREK